MSLVIKNLHAKVQGTEILKGINLEIPKGEVHAIMGPNGREDVHADVAVAFAATVRYYSSLLTEA